MRYPLGGGRCSNERGSRSKQSLDLRRRRHVAAQNDPVALLRQSTNGVRWDGGESCKVRRAALTRMIISSRCEPMKPATPTMQTTVGFLSPLDLDILCCACALRGRRLSTVVG